MNRAPSDFASSSTQSMRAPAIDEVPGAQAAVERGARERARRPSRGRSARPSPRGRRARATGRRPATRRRRAPRRCPAGGRRRRSARRRRLPLRELHRLGRDDSPRDAAAERGRPGRACRAATGREPGSARSAEAVEAVEVRARERPLDRRRRASPRASARPPDDGEEAREVDALGPEGEREVLRRGVDRPRGLGVEAPRPGRRRRACPSGGAARRALPRGRRGRTSGRGASAPRPGPSRSPTGAPLPAPGRRPARRSSPRARGPGASRAARGPERPRRP